MEYHQGTSVHIMAVSEIKEKEKGEVYLRRKWLKTSQILGVKKDKETNKAQMTPNRINPKQITLRLIIIKLSKSRTRGILKVAIENLLVIYKRTPIKLSASFSAKPHSSGESVLYIQSTERKKKISTKNTFTQKQ